MSREIMQIKKKTIAVLTLGCGKVIVNQIASKRLNFNNI